MIIRDLKINNMDICLTSVIYTMHKEQKEIYINKVLDMYKKVYNTSKRKVIIQKIKWLKDNGYINYYYQESRYGRIPSFIMVTDKLLMSHKLSVLIALLRQDENKFNEVAEPTLKKVLEYLKQRKDGR